jgi:glycosyltransferase involved in cell wall biosynthesis
MLDFYLSETSVSDLSGGGLTLQRVLGADLDRFSLFVHVHRRARKYPASEKLRPRCIDLSMWLKTPAASQWLGCRPAYWLEKRPFLNRWHARRAAAKICARLPAVARPVRGLVIPQEVDSLYVTEAVRRVHSIEYITWVMDDRFVRWRDGQWCYPPNVEPLFARHLRHARVVFVISPAMADFYRERFGVESRVLFGPSDVPSASKQRLHPSAGALRLAYFGAVEGWQMDVLELVAQSCANAAVTLDIYSGLTELPRGLNFPSVRLKRYVPSGQVVETMRCYDAVLLPISFRSEMRQFSELNFATKMSECLASGVPTLAVGPVYAAMVRFLKQHAAALCVTEPSAEAMAAGLARLRDVELRRELVGAARTVAREQLSTQAMREVWSQGVAELASLQKLNS